MVTKRPWPTSGVEAIAAVVWLEASYQVDIAEDPDPEVLTRELYISALSFMGFIEASGCELRCDPI